MQGFMGNDKLKGDFMGKFENGDLSKTSTILVVCVTTRSEVQNPSELKTWTLLPILFSHGLL